MHVERENTSELLLCVYPAVKGREICEQITNGDIVVGFQKIAEVFEPTSSLSRLVKKLREKKSRNCL